MFDPAAEIGTPIRDRMDENGGTIIRLEAAMALCVVLGAYARIL